MYPSSLTIVAGMLMGFASSLHCAGMCGSIGSALMLTTQPEADMGQRARMLLVTQFGRVLAYAAAALAVAGVFLAGQLLRIRGHAYYVIVAGLAFLAVDAAVWWRFGIMPGPKSYQDGFVPAAIMGVFLGPLYRVIAPVPR